ncbi:MAG: hypothetical protein GY714_04130 [Desulfobacterales bacterium]|nr:hypothetical protein [Desulfobacterales bacterium]MCP4163168.1 hypothetical protein [Deltaproteobacteria bacterium]
MQKYKSIKIIVISFMLSLISASRSYSFIGGPPITTLSAAMLLLNFGLFTLSFSISVCFQGWFMSSRHDEIKLLESTFQSLIAKICFLFYAIPILILSDILGISSVLIIDYIPIFSKFSNNPWFAGILYFSLGLVLITNIVSKIEFYIFSRKWPIVEIIRLRRTITISNTLIFAVALILIVVSK